MLENENNTKTFDSSQLLKDLTLLRDGLVKNGEQNKHIEKMSSWIENIDSIDTIKDIAENMHYKIDPRCDYYDTTEMFVYLTNYWTNGEYNKKDLSAFYPIKDAYVELKQVFADIKADAEKCIGLFGNNQGDFDREQNSLSQRIRKLCDTMLRIYTFDPQKAANVCRLSLHTAEIDGLKEIIEYFDIDKNNDALEYILNFCKHFIYQNHWGDLHIPIEGICNMAKAILEGKD